MENADTPPDGLLLVVGGEPLQTSIWGERVPAILVVEDDPLASAVLGRTFRRLECPVLECATVAELSNVDPLDFVVILLDIGLPDGNGIDACRALRRRGFAGGIVMISGQSDRGTKAESLMAGADDFVTKPYDTAELIWRVAAVARRVPHWHASVEPTGSQLGFGPVRLDPASGGAWVRGEYRATSRTRYRLLEALVMRRGARITAAEIGSEVQGGARGESSSRNLVHELRADLGCRGDIVLSVRGGWCLAPHRPESGERPATRARAPSSRR